MIETMTFSQILRRKMHDYGFKSAYELADAVGVYYTYILRMLNDAPHDPRIETRKALCRVLDIDATVMSESILRQRKAGG